MTFLEATKLLIEDPEYPLDMNQLSELDQTKVRFWLQLCDMVLEQESILDEWRRENK